MTESSTNKFTSIIIYFPFEIKSILITNIPTYRFSLDSNSMNINESKENETSLLHMSNSREYSLPRQTSNSILFISSGKKKKLDKGVHYLLKFIDAILKITVIFIQGLIYPFTGLIWAIFSSGNQKWSLEFANLLLFALIQAILILNSMIPYSVSIFILLT